MKDFIIDWHCHSQMKAFAHSFKPEGPTYFNSPNPADKNSVWRTDQPTAKDIKENINGLLGLTHFTQADIITCLKGKVRVVCSSLYPLEQGFTKPFNNDGILADKIVNGITQFGKPRIDYIQDIQDYFVDLEQEYLFQKSEAGKIKWINGQAYRYQFVNSYDDLLRVVKQNTAGITDLAIINSIEGAHCFGTGIKPYNLNNRLDQVLNRIKRVKSEWDHPPFFITLAHHFYNEICGHAKSLGMAGLVLDQRYGMNKGFSKAGKKVLHTLLDDQIGQRILIDIKHMSLTARKQYYQILKNDYNFSIPIMVSHGCVNGFDHRFLGFNRSSKIGDKPHKKFRRDDINFYDFEIVNIKKSNGIFGIQLDEKRIASPSEKKKVKKINGKPVLFHSAKLVWNQIQHIAEVLDRNGLFAWDIQSLGSDFDGIINPIDGCFTAMDFEKLAKFLLIHARHYVQLEMPTRIQHGYNRIEAQEIVDRFLRDNALAFLEMNFCGQSVIAPAIEASH